MESNHFYRAIFLRLILIIALSITGSYLYFEKQSYVFSILILMLLIMAVINIIKYFNGINRWISFFLLGIENEDTTLKVPAKSGNKAIDEVFKGMERLNDLFRQVKIDISTKEQYFRMVINQSATGLFSINEKGRVININPAAEKLTGLKSYHHVNSLSAIDKALPLFIMNTDTKLNKKSTIFENKYGQKLLFKLSEIVTQNEVVKLIAVSDITKELDNGEVDAWIKLARTLSHEIMNNIAPITTLSKVISGYFVKDNISVLVRDIEPSTILNTVKGLNVIEERSVGLMNFVENYRKFTKLPSPQPHQVSLTVLIENCLIAATAFSNFNTINVKKILPKSCMVFTDDKLLSQVVINLLKNAYEALIVGNVKNPLLVIRLFEINETIKIEIINNGKAIPVEIREQIFVPFYTTKDSGSGVGLSLSKQIMLKMGGDVLLVKSVENETKFAISID